MVAVSDHQPTSYICESLREVPYSQSQDPLGEVDLNLTYR